MGRRVSRGDGVFPADRRSPPSAEPAFSGSIGKMKTIAALLVIAPLLLGATAVVANEPAVEPAVETRWDQALRAKDMAAIDHLLDEGADPNRTAAGQRTALMFASEHGDLALVGKLIDAGASVTARNQYNGNALMFAAKGGSEAVARRLIDEGADVNTVADLGWTALLVASAKGNVEISLFLISRGADVNAQDKNGWTPLMHAVTDRHPEMVHALLEIESVDPNLREESGSTALPMAAMTGDIDVTRGLIARGADPLARTSRGYTPVQVALEAKHTELAHLLEASAPGAEGQRTRGADSP